MLRPSTNVFVSYSHADASLVGPVVKLLRVNKSLVFQDTDGIQPGKKWRSEIAKALAESHLVVVFWCDHARRSDEVSKEWKAALEQDKDLLPLLLDATPLPPELGDFQWIDFRATVGPSHTSIVSPPNDTKPSEPRMSALVTSIRGLSLGGIAALLVAFVVGSLLTKSPENVPATNPTPVPGPTPLPPSPPEVFDTFPGEGILLWLALLLAVAGCAAWWLRRRSKGSKRLRSASADSREIEHHLAREIEVEILRRTSGNLLTDT